MQMIAVLPEQASTDVATFTWNLLFHLLLLDAFLVATMCRLNLRARSVQPTTAILLQWAF